MRKLASLAFALAIAPNLIACGDDGDTVEPGEASLAAVFPSTGFAGRTTRVQITGENAAWTAPTVSFGEGVTVSNVEVITPSAIFADVTVDAGATFGTRSVTVTDGEALTIADSFTIESPVEVEVTGTLAQGSIAQLVIKNRDIDSPFDTTFTGDGFFEPIVYVGIQLTAPTGVDLTSNIVDVQEYSITTLALIDVNAAPGAFSVTSGVEAASQIVSSGTTLEIAPRTAMTLTSGTPVTGTVEGPLTTSLYEFSASAGDITSMAVTAMSEDAAPAIALLGSSGSFSELLEFAPSVFGELPTKTYAIVWDNSGFSGYEYTLGALSRTFNTVAEAANETRATAQTLTTPGRLTATLAAPDDQDWVKFEVTAADVGKKIYASTIAGDPQADTILAIFNGAGGLTQFGTTSSDQNYHESLVSPTITTAGTYYVRVTASDFQVPNAMTDDYSLLVYIE